MIKIINCLETTIRNKIVLKIYMIISFFIKYMLYKNAHDATIFIFFKCYHFLDEIGCANFDAVPISPPCQFRRYSPNSNNFQHIEKILRTYTSLDNLGLQKPINFESIG